MKNLKNFLKFDWNSFISGKELTVTGVSELVDYKTKKHLGTKVEVKISVDNTDYQSSKYSNLYENMTIKVLADVNVDVNDKVLPVNPTVTAYGIDRDGSFTSAYINRLAIQCDAIDVL